MVTNAAVADRSRTLPIILLAAVVQGWGLYALHLAANNQTWPATVPGWLLGLYAVIVFVPLTVQLLAQHVRQRIMWGLIGAMSILYFYFGWHYGTQVTGPSTIQFLQRGAFVLPAFVLCVQWLMLLPFIQSRLAVGRWRVPYALLFATAWRNKLQLAEAALFTMFFWLLLFLWAKLFAMLGIGFFDELFKQPIFIYPVTSLCFGIALHLIGSLERMTNVLLEQILGLLKWLAILAGLILAMFGIALVFNLKSLLLTDASKIGAAWLLWLIAVTVLLVNAGFRDGSSEQPYPKLVGYALKAVIPLTVLIAATALYGLYVRVDNYGFTVSRVWAWIVGIAAMLYAVGYAMAAFQRGPWMRGIARVNVVVAIALILTISLTMTPVLSPHRIAAESQYRIALRGGPESDASVFAHLRFDAGQYGMRKLQALAEITDAEHADSIRQRARHALAREDRWTIGPEQVAQAIDQIVTYPAGAMMDPELRKLLAIDLRNKGRLLDPPSPVGLYVDLNGSGSAEFILLKHGNAHVYSNDSGQWRAVGMMFRSGPWTPQMEADALREGKIETQEPKWKELRVGDSVYRLTSAFGYPEP